MFKKILVAFIAAVSAVSAIPASTSKIVESTEFSGNFADAVVGIHNLTSPAGSSLERRQYGTFQGTLYLCSGANCASGCYAISTEGASGYNQCLFTIPNPFYSFGLANPPTGYYYPFYVGINIAPAACPTDIWELTVANTCYNIPGGGNGWTLENGDIAGQA
ncbi:hypothetical protein HYPSUDRAFT_46985 [Hypholoma sublateritium FD-334 SS-4]|uniref:Uncharacterized protein n=1 Tax=Hypholoma sublateritium (strain FD-334 SS-4) TaxID=945553 RepID=A0A0D2M0V7_HYPSF|nr:hypothetical protein HYPSUDRAFT_46985 [Hypholoma sublateritium FD-334 SS-4]